MRVLSAGLQYSTIPAFLLLDERRPLNRILAAASCHLAGYAASAYSVLRMTQGAEPPDLMLRVISLVLERDLTSLDEIVRGAAVDFYWNNPEQNAQVNQVQRDGSALAQNFAHAIGLFVYAMRLNKREGMDECLRRLDIGERFALSTGDVWSTETGWAVLTAYPAGFYYE